MSKQLKYAVLSQDLVLTAKAPAIPVPDVHVQDLLLPRLARHGDKVLLIHSTTGDSMTSSQVLKTASRMSDHLKKLGIKDGDVILGFCDNSLHYACFSLSASEKLAAS